MTITKTLARKMAKDLRTVYEQWEFDPSQTQFRNGICRAVTMVTYPITVDWEIPYNEIAKVLKAVEHGFLVYLPRDCEGSWEPRATMCLLMAEWLETEILERKP